MPFKNIGLTVYLKAWDNDNGTWKTGYHASITPRGCGDGTIFTPAGSASEVSATYLPGVYKITLTDAENNYDVNAVGGSAVDSTISIHGMEWLNLPIDFSVTQKTSLNASTPASIQGAVNSVTTTVNANIVSTANIDFSATQKASINTEADSALTDYDPPTRAELTTDKDSIITEVNANETKIDSITAKLPTNYIMGSAVQTAKDDEIDAILGDTNELQTLIVAGRVPAKVEVMDPDVLTASALATDAVTEIINAVSSNTDIISIKSKTDVLAFTGTDVKATLDGETVVVGTNNDKTGYGLSAGTITALKDAILDEAIDGTITVEKLFQIISARFAGDGTFTDAVVTTTAKWNNQADIEVVSEVQTATTITRTIP